MVIVVAPGAVVTPTPLGIDEALWVLVENPVLVNPERVLVI